MSSVIQLSGVGKRYSKLVQQPTLLRSLVPIKGEVRRDLWALRGIDLEVAQGETVGVVGHNGAGKTTLLRLLAGVTRPTLGRVRVQGRIGPLISLGVGFHDEMTGRENVMVNGMLLGLTEKQVRDRFAQIVEFADLQDFIDTPVKFYSSGMFMRLGFAVIAHIDPAILLVDEVLAVGDARFERKCFARLRALRNEGATIVMVSHSTYMVRQVCERAVVMGRGRIEYDGDVEQAIAMHQHSSPSGPRAGAERPVEVISCQFRDSQREWVQAEHDELVELNLRLRFNRRVEDPVIVVGAVTDVGLFAGLDTTPPQTPWRTFGPGEEAKVRITLPVRLGSGTYRLVVDVKDRAGHERLVRSDDLILKVVGGRDGSSGLVDVRAEIELSDARPAEFEQA
jgi:ABC-type polysaccharide/polyol phosphate transport system ATPase subunit